MKGRAHTGEPKNPDPPTEGLAGRLVTGAGRDLGFTLGRDGAVERAAHSGGFVDPATADHEVDEEDRRCHEGDGGKHRRGERTGGWQPVLHQRAGDAHGEPDGDGDREVPQLGRDDCGEGRHHEQSEVAGISPMIGADSTPTSPASPMLTAQTPIDMALGLVPDSEVIAGESTMARTRRPTSV